jgi:ribosomal protein S18 acetylase RimI-like enzyme
LTKFHIERLYPKTLPRLQELLACGYFVHRHNDWLNPEDILEEGYVFILNDGQKTVSVIGLSKPAHQLSWLHFLVVLNRSCSLAEVWKSFFKDLQIQRIFSGVRIFFIPDEVLIGLLNPHLTFRREGEVIFMQTTGTPLLKQNCESRLEIVSAPTSEEISFFLESSFPPLWRLSIRNIERSLEASDDKLFFEKEGKLVGYLLSNRDEGSVNISRLAVASDHWQKGIGTEMLSIFFESFPAGHHQNFTVNTYGANHAAIALYRKFGFRLCDRRLPVYSFFMRSDIY